MKSIIKEMCLFASLSTKGSVENASKFYLNLLRKIQPKNPPQEALLKRLNSTVNGIVSLSASPSFQGH